MHRQFNKGSFFLTCVSIAALSVCLWGEVLLAYGHSLGDGPMFEGLLGIFFPTVFAVLAAASGYLLKAAAPSHG